MYGTRASRTFSPTRGTTGVGHGGPARVVLVDERDDSGFAQDRCHVPMLPRARAVNCAVGRRPWTPGSTTARLGGPPLAAGLRRHRRCRVRARHLRHGRRRGPLAILFIPSLAGAYVHHLMVRSGSGLAAPRYGLTRDAAEARRARLFGRRGVRPRARPDRRRPGLRLGDDRPVPSPSRTRPTTFSTSPPRRCARPGSTARRSTSIALDPARRLRLDGPAARERTRGRRGDGVLARRRGAAPARRPGRRPRLPVRDVLP